ncbi:MAG: tetratricopeptide repeat protein [Spirulinaceae cyanobacterium RM2_2_10]|nr:tetratricopeptide repeat protein [Spirulinaceae cyanobacterium RM2_2_10]
MHFNSVCHYEPADLSPARGAPGHLSALVSAGGQFWEREQYEEALFCYEKALEHQPQDYRAWYGRGKTLEELGRYREAVESFQQAAQARPHDYWAWYNQGYLALLELGDYERAAQCFQQALDIDPEDYWSRYRLGESWRQWGQLEEAIACFDRLLNTCPQDFWAWYRRGDALRQAQHYAEAARSYEQALALRPDDYWGWMQRSAMFCELGWWQARSPVIGRRSRSNPMMKPRSTPRPVATHGRAIARVCCGHWVGCWRSRRSNTPRACRPNQSSPPGTTTPTGQRCCLLCPLPRPRRWSWLNPTPIHLIPLLLRFRRRPRLSDSAWRSQPSFL